MHSRDEPLPHRPKRVLVAGVSGSDKTTQAGRIAGITGGPHLEIDAIFQLRREELWNGNVEAPLRTFFTDRGHIVRWAIRTRRKYTELMPHLSTTTRMSASSGCVRKGRLKNGSADH